MDKDETIKNFNKIYYDSRVWLGKTHWLGVETLKSPMDLWIFQEIIYETKPSLIIETGTHRGGSALFMANILDEIGSGKIITIDIANLVKEKDKHPIVTYINGSSVDVKTLDKVKEKIYSYDRTMVILDSDHSKEHVLNELKLYNNFVSKGCYLIVEDTNICEDIQPTHIHLNEGPMEAINEFMKENDNFTIDHSREKFMATFNPNGFLKRKE